MGVIKADVAIKKRESSGIIARRSHLGADDSKCGNKNDKNPGIYCRRGIYAYIIQITTKL